MTAKVPSHRIIQIEWPEFGQAFYPRRRPSPSSRKGSTTSAP